MALTASGCSLFTDNIVTLKYYQIGGNSITQIDDEIRKKGPLISGTQHAVAVSNIKMIPDVSMVSTNNGCVIARARIKVHTIITLPHWKNRPEANPKLAKAWDNLDRYTRLHEAVHVSIAHKYAKQLELRLRTMNTAETCTETERMANRIIQTTLKSHEIEQLKFDASEKTRLATLGKRNKAL